MKNSDLHTHSYYSDGELSPRKIVMLAKKRGLKNIALTDHTSVKGVREAINEGKKIGIEVIPAIEFRFDDGEILGYFIDVDNKKLKEAIGIIQKRQQDRIRKTCKILKKAGYDISFGEIQKRWPNAKGNYNGFHPIFLLHLKMKKSPFEIIDEIGAKGILGQKMRDYSGVKVIKLIKKAKGVSVLAHPWFSEESLKKKNFEKLVKAGLKGLEISNGDISPLKTRKIHNKIKKLAKKYNLILTRGTDFHGSNRAKLMLGKHDLGENNCDEKIVKKLEKLANN